MFTMNYYKNGRIISLGHNTCHIALEKTSSQIKSVYLRNKIQDSILREYISYVPKLKFQTERMWVKHLLRWSGDIEWEQYKKCCTCKSETIIAEIVKRGWNNRWLDIPAELRTSLSAIEAVKKDKRNLRYVRYNLQTEELIRICIIPEQSWIPVHWVRPDLRKFIQ